MPKFFDFPQAIPAEEYDRQRTDFLASLSKEIEISAAYEIGERELLGVSDIDLLIVSPSVDAVEFAEKVKRGFSLIDSVFVVEQNGESQFSRTHHYLRYSCVFGTSHISEFPEIDEEKAISGLRMLFGKSLLRAFYPIFFSSQVSVRDLLQFLASFRYAVAFSKILFPNSVPQWILLTEEISALRKNWYKDMDALVAWQLLPRVIHACWEMIELLAERFPDTSSVKIRGGRFPTIALDLSQKNEYRLRTEKYLQNHQKSRFLWLPKSLFENTEHAFSSPLLSAALWIKTKFDLLSLRRFFASYQ